VRNIVATFRALCVWAKRQGWIETSPCTDVALPTGEKARDRVADPAEALILIEAVPVREQTALGSSIYAGLRMGEIVALDREAVDLGERIITVRRGWDARAREFVPTKNRKTRKVPINSRLNGLLVNHFVLNNHPPPDGLLFPGHDPEYPIHPKMLRAQTKKAWKARKLTPLDFHEGRHSFASIAIAAGMQPKTLSTIMGHATLAITYDRYGHLFPGAEQEAADLLDAYLD
jgi:integrase